MIFLNYTILTYNFCIATKLPLLFFFSGQNKGGGVTVYGHTPMYGSGQTPMYGNQTPMHGSRTPMYGNQTPMHDGK